MKTTSVRPLKSLRAALLPLLTACPVDDLNPESCPLHDVRCLPSGEREAFLLGLNREELQFLASYHHLCMKLKCECQLLSHA